MVHLIVYNGVKEKKGDLNYDCFCNCIRYRSSRNALGQYRIGSGKTSSESSGIRSVIRKTAPFA